MIDALTAVLVQFAPQEPEANLRQIVNHLDQMAGDTGRLVVFPELALSGFPVGGGVRAETWEASAYLDAIDGAARRSGLHAVVGFAERGSGQAVYNSAAVFGPEGPIGVVRKRHLPGLERAWFTPGGPPTVFPTSVGVLGVAICYDAWFPEYVKEQAVRGAEIVVNINSVWAGGRDGGIGDGAVKRRYWRMVPPARALDSQVYVLACNGCGTHAFGPPVGTWRRLGQSRIIDPLGRTLATAPAAEPATLTATLTDAALRQARRGITLLADSRQEFSDDH